MRISALANLPSAAIRLLLCGGWLLGCSSLSQLERQDARTWTLLREGRSQEAVQSARQAVAMAERAVGPDHPARLRTLAALAFATADWPLAEALLARLIPLDEHAVSRSYAAAETVESPGEQALRLAPSNEHEWNPQSPEVMNEHPFAVQRAKADTAQGEYFDREQLARARDREGTSAVRVAVQRHQLVLVRDLEALARACAEQGKRAQAEQALERALQLNREADLPKTETARISRALFALVVGVLEALPERGRCDDPARLQRALELSLEAEGLGPERLLWLSQLAARCEHKALPR